MAGLFGVKANSAQILGVGPVEHDKNPMIWNLVMHFRQSTKIQGIQNNNESNPKIVSSINLRCEKILNLENHVKYNFVKEERIPKGQNTYF